MYTDGSAAWAYVSMDYMCMYISSSTYTTIYSNYAGGTSQGGVMYVGSLQAMYITGITATDIYASKSGSSNSNGDGRFLYYYSGQTFTFDIHLSTITCSSTAFT